jgi:predicted enzyme related to lactoylglutathione lyase
MSESESPRHFFGNGRVAYVQIPALDVHVSARFYAETFGWQVRGGGDAHLSFTDATGDMIGAWVTGRPIPETPGVVLYVYVHGLDAALERIVRNGGLREREPYPEGDIWVATFRDPAGNLVGVWQKEPR